jgi:hypothetical protein
MKLRLLAVMLLLYGKGLTQVQAEAGTTRASFNRLSIAGTKYSMLVPSGYKASSTFNGFQNSTTGGSILLMELPGPFDTVIKALSPEMFRNENMELISTEKVSVNKDSGILIKLTQTLNGITYNKMVLVFGDGEKTVMVNTVLPENSKEDEPRLREALFSISFNQEQDDDPLNAAAFSVNTDGSGLMVVKYLAGTLFYAGDGKLPTKTATLLVGNSLGAVAISDPAGYAEQRLKKLPRGEFNVIKQKQPLRIDNLDGFEIIAYGKSEANKPELVYLTLLFKPDGGYYIINGMTVDEFPAWEEKFKRIARSFKRKP